MHGSASYIGISLQPPLAPSFMLIVDAGREGVGRMLPAEADLWGLDGEGGGEAVEQEFCPSKFDSERKAVWKTLHAAEI